MYLEADSVTVDSDEGQFTLEISTCAPDGERVTVNIHGIDLDAFYDQVKGRIGPYLQEMHAARDAIHPPAWHPDSAATDEEKKETHALWERQQDAYDPADPKHPDFHSVHADIWDARAGK